MKTAKISSKKIIMRKTTSIMENFMSLPMVRITRKVTEVGNPIRQMKIIFIMKFMTTDWKEVQTTTQDHEMSFSKMNLKGMST